MPLPKSLSSEHEICFENNTEIEIESQAENNAILSISENQQQNQYHQQPINCQLSHLPLLQITQPINQTSFHLSSFQTQALIQPPSLLLPPPLPPQTPPPPPSRPQPPPPPIRPPPPPTRLLPLPPPLPPPQTRQRNQPQSISSNRNITQNTTYLKARQAIFLENNNPHHFLGEMSLSCSKCWALHWIDEKLNISSVQNPVFSHCCDKGKIILPAVTPLPESFVRLLSQNQLMSKNLCIQQCICIYKLKSQY